MSLIGIRRERRSAQGGPSRPPRLWKLLVTLGLILYLIWHLGRLAGS
jgi:hypothetical protein